MDLILGVRRPRNWWQALQSPRSVSLPWSALRRHARAVASSVTDEGLAILAISMARQVLARGGRVVVVDGYRTPLGLAGQEVDALSASLAAHFPGRLTVTNGLELPRLRSVLLGEPLEAGEEGVVVVTGSAARLHPKTGCSMASEVLREAAFSRMGISFPSSAENPYAGVGSEHGSLPVLVVVRCAGTQPWANLSALLRAADIAVLHLGAESFNDPGVVANTVTALYVGHSRRSGRWCWPVMAHSRWNDTAADLEGELLYLDPRLGVPAVRPAPANPVELAEAPVPEVPAEPLQALTLGVAYRPGLFGARLGAPLSLPWSEALGHIRVAPGPSQRVVAMHLAKQVAQAGGRVVLMDPLSGPTDYDQLIDHFLCVFPQARWLNRQAQLPVLADLFDEAAVAQTGCNAVLLSGELAQATVVQEGEWGQVRQFRALDVVHMANFAKQLAARALEGGLQGLPPVLLMVRRIEVDSRTAAFLEGLAAFNIVVMVLEMPLSLLESGHQFCRIAIGGVRIKHARRWWGKPVVRAIMVRRGHAREDWQADLEDCGFVDGYVLGLFEPSASQLQGTSDDATVLEKE